MQNATLIHPASLYAVVETAAQRQAVVRDAGELVSAEVDKQRGPLGFVVKQAYRVVQALDNGRLINKAINLMLDDFIAALEPFYQSWRAQPAAPNVGFDAWLLSQPDAVTAALLGVTDSRRARVHNRVLTTAYDRLRPAAERHVRAALPGVAVLVASHVAA